jgi:hypothetical protein
MRATEPTERWLPPWTIPESAAVTGAGCCNRRASGRAPTRSRRSSRSSNPSVAARQCRRSGSRRERGRSVCAPLPQRKACGPPEASRRPAVSPGSTRSGRRTSSPLRRGLRCQRREVLRGGYVCGGYADEVIGGSEDVPSRAPPGPSRGRTRMSRSPPRPLDPWSRAPGPRTRNRSRRDGRRLDTRGSHPHAPARAALGVIANSGRRTNVTDLTRGGGGRSSRGRTST